MIKMLGNLLYIFLMSRLRDREYRSNYREILVFGISSNFWTFSKKFEKLIKNSKILDK